MARVVISNVILLSSLLLVNVTRFVTSDWSVMTQTVMFIFEAFSRLSRRLKVTEYLNINLTIEACIIL